jgi:hypothetical protein
MTTVQVQLDDEVLALLRAEARARMKPVSEIIRVAAGRWLVNHRVLRQKQLNDLRAAERLGLLVTGIQQTTTPQVNMPSIVILKAAGVVRGDGGINSEAATE